MNDVKLEIKKKRWKTEKCKCKLNNAPLNNECVKQEITREINNNKYLETNENGNKTCQNVWDTGSSNMIQVYGNKCT